MLTYFTHPGEKEHMVPPVGYAQSENTHIRVTHNKTDDNHSLALI